MLVSMNTPGLCIPPTAMRNTPGMSSQASLGQLAGMGEGPAREMGTLGLSVCCQRGLLVLLFAQGKFNLICHPTGEESLGKFSSSLIPSSSSHGGRG